MCENIADCADTVDPRVHIELERLNNATDEINRLESDLDGARGAFRNLLCDSTAKIDAIRLKLGLCVERAKPYYEARFCANEALKQTQVAAMKYEKANSAHSAAREMVFLAEQGLGGRTLDPAWQEMLNHATQRVNESEHDRGSAAGEHRVACVKHEAANAKVRMLQKELKRAISKSSLSIRRNLMIISNLAYQHELILLPYYEMKAHYNYLLEQQRLRIQTVESQVSTAKLTYAEALRNLEEISDEIHRSRNSKKLDFLQTPKKQNSMDSNESYVDVDFSEEFKTLPPKLNSFPVPNKEGDVSGYKNTPYNISPTSPASHISTEETDEKLLHPNSQSSEWTEINLDVSSPEEEIKEDEKPKLLRQRTLPNTLTDGEFKHKPKLDSSITNWISRSSAPRTETREESSRRQSLDNLLGPTSEKVKEIWSQGMMMLNISALTERRNSEPRAGITEGGKGSKKLPSPLEKTLTYLNVEDDTSDTESLASVDMLNEEQINSLMLDKELPLVCEEVLGTPMNEVVALPQLFDASQSQIQKQASESLI